MKFMFLLLLAIVLTGCVRITDMQGTRVEVLSDKDGFYFAATPQIVKDFAEPTGKKFIANLKGSIYETGEMMTVFGTCFDENQQPVPGTIANFSAWYPNMTQFVFESPMNEFMPGQGYFAYSAAMSNVQGTYLTQITCYANISGITYTAKAIGEWQNPYWVARIAMLNDSISSLNFTANLTPILDAINITIGNLTLYLNSSFATIYGAFTQLNDTLNQSVYALNQSIYYAASVANSSVDRNDSYLAMLLQNLTALELAELAPPNGTLNYTEVADRTIYQRQWYIYVTAYDGSNVVQYPDGNCLINTTLTTTPVSMTPQGNHFVYNERITMQGNFQWTVACAYV
jgi:hypothetical protein